MAVNLNSNIISHSKNMKSSLSLHKSTILIFIQSSIFALFFMVTTYRIIFYNLSFLSQLLIFLFFVFGAKGILINIQKSSDMTKKLLFANFILSTILILYSLLYQQNELSLIIRFYFIANLLVLVFFYPINKKMVSLFLFVVFFHALFIIGFEIFMILNFELTTYGPIRLYVNEIGIGDVYTFDGKFWRIQLAGNSTIPVALFISMYYLKGKKRFLLATIFLIASVFSGHFAFLISISMFFIAYYIINTKMNYNNIVKLFIVFFIIGIATFKPIYEYASHTIEKKSEVSLSTRGDLVNVLFEDMSTSFVELIVGKGFGNTPDIVTNYRDYRGKIYYEIQTLYLLNQFGFVYFFWFVFLNIYLFFLKIQDKNIFLIYFSFILYAFTNPYMFDSAHVFLIAVLLSLNLIKKEQSHEK